MNQDRDASFYSPKVYSTNISTPCITHNQTIRSPNAIDLFIPLSYLKTDLSRQEAI